MGNPDLVIIINNFVVIILGKDYDKRNGAVQQAMTKFEESCKEYEKSADKPEELEGGWDEIKEIKIYKLSQK